MFFFLFNLGANKQITAISETTTKLNLNINFKKDNTSSSSPLPSNNFSNATKTQSNLYQGSNLPIAVNLQTTRELTMDNETSKYTHYDDKGLCVCTFFFNFKN